MLNVILQNRLMAWLLGLEAFQVKLELLPVWALRLVWVSWQAT